MTLVDYNFRSVPEYYDWMYLDGYKPEEILYSLREKMKKETADQETAPQSLFDAVKINSEVRIKR